MHNDAYDINRRYRSRIILRNEAGQEAIGENLVTYQGGDVLAGLVAGRSTYKISHMYFEYENTAGAPTAGVAARTDTAVSRQAVSAPKDLIRAPLIAVPTLTAADGNHVANRATFYALTTATTGLISSLPFTAGANSKIYAACLVAAPGGNTTAQDLVYARYILSVVLPVTGTGQCSGTWIADFN